MSKKNDALQSEEQKAGVYVQGRSLYFFTDINSESVVRAIMFLQSLRRQKAPIEIVINSDGGYVYDGLALYDYLTTLNNPLTTVGTGFIASMAVPIFLAGQKRYMTKTARLMSHQVSSQIQGRESDIKISYEETKELGRICNEIIAEKTGTTVKKIANEIKLGDKFLSAKQCLERGYIHKII